MPGGITMEKKKNQAVSPTLEELRQELHQTNQALRNAYDKFNFVTAPELVEASIYEINALKARSDYLLRCIISFLPVRSYFYRSLIANLSPSR